MADLTLSQIAELRTEAFIALNSSPTGTVKMMVRATTVLALLDELDSLRMAKEDLQMRMLYED